MDDPTAHATAPWGFCNTKAHLGRGGHHGWDRVETIPTWATKEWPSRELVLDKKKR
jgi:hypothetical protein